MRPMFRNGPVHRVGPLCYCNYGFDKFLEDLASAFFYPGSLFSKRKEKGRNNYFTAVHRVGWPFGLRLPKLSALTFCS